MTLQEITSPPPVAPAEYPSGQESKSERGSDSERLAAKVSSYLRRVGLALIRLREPDVLFGLAATVKQSFIAPLQAFSAREDGAGGASAVSALEGTAAWLVAAESQVTLGLGGCWHGGN